MMNARQLQAFQQLAKDSSSRVSDRQVAAMRANAPTADDILDNPAYLDELNEEINYTIEKEGLDQPPTEDFVPEEPVMPPVAAAPSGGGTLAGLSKSEDLEAELKALQARIEEAAKEEAAARQAAAAEAAAAEPEITASPEDTLRDQMLGLLAKTPGAPSPEQIAALKKQYGENGVQLLALGEGDLYIYTYLRRSQWKRIQEIVNAAAQTEAFAEKAEEMLKEKVIQHCVLWPQGVSGVEFLYQSRAGVVDTLFQVIMLSSYFLEPAQALQLTVAL